MKSALFLTCLAVVIPAVGATFIVNHTSDRRDSAPGDGVCRADNSKCTLRAAIEEANSSVALDTVIVPAGVYVLRFGQLRITNDITIRGAGMTKAIIDGGVVYDPDGYIIGGFRVFLVTAGSVVRMSTLTMRNGAGLPASQPSQDGGCIANRGQLTLNTVAVDSCGSDTSGGGIANFGKLTILDSQIVGNFARSVGGGVSNAAPEARLKMTRTTVSGNFASEGNGNGSGGGVWNSGFLEVAESTFTRNVADSSGGGISNDGTAQLLTSTFDGNSTFSCCYGGGGIANEGAGTMTITNCTISGNVDQYRAGGVYNNGQLVVQNSTIYGNTSTDGGIGGLTSGYDSKSTIVKNSIIAGNRSDSGGTTPDCNSISSLEYSLIGNTTECTIPAGRGNMLNVDPLLGPLANNGGKTQTHALLNGSPALDFGSPAKPGSGGNACEKTDQRGVGRPQNGRCDMGAYELWPGHPQGPDLSDEGEESEIDQP